MWLIFGQLCWWGLVYVVSDVSNKHSLAANSLLLRSSGSETSPPSSTMFSEPRVCVWGGVLQVHSFGPGSTIRHFDWLWFSVLVHSVAQTRLLDEAVKTMLP